LAALFERRGIVFTTVCERLEIRRAVTESPHQLNITMRLLRSLPAGAHLMEIPSDVPLQQVRRDIAWTPGLLGYGMSKAQRFQIKTLDVGIDETTWLILLNGVIDDVGKKHALSAVPTPDIAHLTSRTVVVVCVVITIE
jgi:hypothetical protein